MKVGLSLMLEEDFLKAAYPLFESGGVEALEWSFDMCWGSAQLPPWAEDLLNTYGENDSLYGHGVSLSLFSGNWTERHQRWVSLFSEECNKRKYQHISEHFGFTTSQSFAPLPVPITDHLLTLGEERIKKLQDVARTPIGIENLAFAFCPKDVQEQGIYLKDLLRRTDGFLLLDLHNLYCQMFNFKKTADEILNFFPLDRVREIHISGGSWSAVGNGPNEKCRRDTHDGPVPDEVFQLLKSALKLCPAVECVFLERLGNTFLTKQSTNEFQSDFQTMRKIVKGN